jgi:DNA-directed RNA polymerase subunit N (RpoN/RPB10)
MLKRCAEGSDVEEKLHHHWVRYKGKTFRSLSKGSHGAKVPEAQIGEVDGMIDFLGIDKDCARRMIPQLPRKSKKKPGE